MSQDFPDLAHLPVDDDRYRLEVVRLPAITNFSAAEREALVRRARAQDEQAKQDLILSCLYDVLQYAAMGDRKSYQEVLDRAQDGNVAMLAALPRALASRDPIRSLCAEARKAMARPQSYQTQRGRRSVGGRNRKRQ